MAPIDSENDIFGQVLRDLPPACVAILIPISSLCLSLYAFAKRWTWTFRWLSVVTLIALWSAENVTPLRCAAMRALFKFAVASATMKLLDIHALCLTSSFPTYTADNPPRPSIMALILLTELRYESFTPNNIRASLSLSRNKRFYDERIQLLIHISIFAGLQLLPQFAVTKALGVLLMIWILWTAIQVILRYPSSPPLFGPIYLADSLASFWTETWHNAFASPCYSLAYQPTSYILSKIGMPRPVARSAGVVASFALMAAFHVYSLSPLLSDDALRRIGIFFVGNGILTVLEAAVWKKKKHWLRTVLAWSLEIGIASWTIDAAGIPDGVWKADWRGLCRPKMK